MKVTTNPLIHPFSLQCLGPHRHCLAIHSIPLYVLISYTKVRRIPGKAAENLRFCDHVVMAVIAKSNGTFNQKHQGSNIQSNRNNDLKHSSNHLLLQS